MFANFTIAGMSLAPTASIRTRVPSGYRFPAATIPATFRGSVAWRAASIARPPSMKATLKPPRWGPRYKMFRFFAFRRSDHPALGE